MEIEVHATLDSNPTVTNTQAKIPILFSYICFSSRIELSVVEELKTSLAAPLDFELPEISDTATSILAVTPGYETYTCGSFSVSQLN